MATRSNLLSQQYITSSRPCGTRKVGPFPRPRMSQGRTARAQPQTGGFEIYAKRSMDPWDVYEAGHHVCNVREASVESSWQRINGEQDVGRSVTSLLALGTPNRRGSPREWRRDKSQSHPVLAVHWHAPPRVNENSVGCRAQRLTLGRRIAPLCIRLGVHFTYNLVGTHLGTSSQVVAWFWRDLKSLVTSVINCDDQGRIWRFKDLGPFQWNIQYSNLKVLRYFEINSIG